MLHPAPGKEQLQAAGIWKAALQSDPSGPGGEGESQPATPLQQGQQTLCHAGQYSPAGQGGGFT